MSILGAALSGFSSGAQNNIAYNREQLRDEVNRLYNKELIQEERAHQTERDYTNRQNQVLDADIATAQDDARYKDSRADIERNHNRADKQLGLMGRSGGTDPTAGLIKDYNKEVSALDNSLTKGEIDAEMHTNLMIRVEERYSRLIPEMFAGGGSGEGGAANPLADKDAAEAAEKSQLDADRKAKQEERERLSKEASESLNEEGFELRQGAGKTISDATAPIREKLSGLLQSSSENFVRGEYERMRGTARSGDAKAFQVQAAWNVVRQGESVYPPGSEERELALRVLRANDANGVPTK